LQGSDLHQFEELAQIATLFVLALGARRDEPEQSRKSAQYIEYKSRLQPLLLSENLAVFRLTVG